MKRLRSLALLVLFLAIYLALVAVTAALVPRQGMLASTLVVLVTAVVVGSFLLVVIERRPWRELGLALQPQTGRELLVGWLLPCAALLLVAVVLMLAGSLTYRGDDGTLPGWLWGSAQLLLALAIPAAAEEALFRGYPFQKLVAALGPVFATVLASAGFAWAHRHNPSVGTFA